MEFKAENCQIAYEMVARLLQQKLDTGYEGLAYSEIEMLCTMLGIRKREDE